MVIARRGAVRSEASRSAILAATAHQFAERGFEHLTIEGIAAEAGVGKQTVYRWWSSKSALVAECLLEGLLLPERFLPANTGDLRADLTSWLHGIYLFIAAPENTTLLRSLVAAAAQDAEVGQRLAVALGAGSALTARFEAAIASGDLPQDAPTAELGEALVGGLVFRVISAAPIDPGLAGRFVDALLGPR